MFTRFRNKRLGKPAAYIAAGALSALVVSGTGVAITSATFRYSEVRTANLTIHPMALAPSDASSANDYDVQFVNAVLSSAGSSCHNTGVHLPQGAKVKAVRVYYTSGGASDLEVFLVRHHLESDESLSLVEQFVADNSNLRRSATLTPAAGLRVVDNKAYSYGFGVCVGPSTSFEGARITYEYRNAGD